jgi:hypothetical protein
MTRLYSTRFDAIGLTASSLCLVHCIGTAALGFALPAWGVGFLGDERIHRTLAVVVLVAGLLAFVPGFRLHRSWPVVICAFLGLNAIALSQLWSDEELREQFEMALTVLGGGTLLLAHWQNRALCRECRCHDCQPPE